MIGVTGVSGSGKSSLINETPLPYSQCTLLQWGKKAIGIHLY